MVKGKMYGGGARQKAYRHGEGWVAQQAMEVNTVVHKQMDNKQNCPPTI